MDQAIDTVDPIVARAITRAKRAHATSRESWMPVPDSVAADAADEARQHADQAVVLLQRGQWDEAIAAAELIAELEEEHGNGTVWRDFVLLVEEAAETGAGTSAASLG